jgi:hypothetical protein
VSKLFKYAFEAVQTHPFNLFTLVFALASAAFAGWSAWEAHKARLEAADATTKANAAAERSAKAAEEGNRLVQRAQKAYLTVKLANDASPPKVFIENVSGNYALNIRANYTLEGEVGVSILGLIKAGGSFSLGPKPIPLTPALASGGRILLYDLPAGAQARPDQRINSSATLETVDRLVGILLYNDVTQPDEIKIPFCVVLEQSKTDKPDAKCDRINSLQFQSGKK